MNDSEYYCDGLHRNLNPDYATASFLQHGVVSVDGKLIPFAYPTNTKSPKIYCHGLPHNPTRNENNTMRLNTNPMNRLDNENMQENFYHTVTPFHSHGQYEESEKLFQCPVHHHLVNYSSDTLPMKISSNNNSKIIDTCQINEVPFSPVHHHHGTCQRQYKTKGVATSVVNKGR